MSSNQPLSSAGRPLTPGAVALMLMLCLSWGFNQIAVKLALPDIPPMLQATIRSSGALVVLFLIARVRGVKLFERDGTLRAGLLAGVIFGVEFVLIYRGLLLTSASRAVVFLYTAPFFVAFGSYVVSRRTAARLAMGRACAVLRRRRAGDRGSPGRCRRQGAARRPSDNRRRSAVGGDHADRQGLGAVACARGKGPGLPGGALGPDSGVCGLDFGRNPDPGSRPAGADTDGLSGGLGGRIDLFDLVCAGQDLLRQQIVGIYLYHPFVWRGG